jgi:hypothetical protein
MRFMQEVMQYQQAEMQGIMMGLFQGTLPLTTANVLEHMLEQHGAISRYSARVLGSEDSGADSDDADAEYRMQGSQAKVQLRFGQGALTLGSPVLAQAGYLHSAGTQVRTATLLQS